MTVVTGAVWIDGSPLSPTATYTTLNPTPGPTVTPYGSLKQGSTVEATVNGASSGTTLGFPAGPVDFSDFDSNGYGCMYWTNITGIVGAGIDATVMQMRPNSSTKAAQVPTAAFTTNQLYVVRVNNSGPGTPNLSGFTVLGTPQGHLYGGLLLFYPTGAQITDVKVKGIPGNNSFPPGETFGINDFHGANTTFTRVEVDGTDSNGVQVGAAGIGFNKSAGATIVDSYVHDHGHSHGVTNYAGTGQVTYRNVRSNRNWTALNFEQVVGTIVIDRCDVTGNRAVAAGGGPMHMVLDSSLGSSKVTITDPIFDGAQFTICCHTKYADGLPNRQVASDVTLIVGGKPRPDLLRIVTNYT